MHDATQELPGMRRTHRADLLLLPRLSHDAGAGPTRDGRSRIRGALTMETLYRIEWTWNGQWRMDDENHPNMTPTRNLTRADAERFERAVRRECPASMTRIVKEDR